MPKTMEAVLPAMPEEAKTPEEAANKIPKYRGRLKLIEGGGQSSAARKTELRVVEPEGPELAPSVAKPRKFSEIRAQVAREHAEKAAEVARAKAKIEAGVKGEVPSLEELGETYERKTKAQIEAGVKGEVPTLGELSKNYAKPEAPKAPTKVDRYPEERTRLRQINAEIKNKYGKTAEQLSKEDWQSVTAAGAGKKIMGFFRGLVGAPKDAELAKLMTEYTNLKEVVTAPAIASEAEVKTQEKAYRKKYGEGQAMGIGLYGKGGEEVTGGRLGEVKTRSELALSRDYETPAKAPVIKEIPTLAQPEAAPVPLTKKKEKPAAKKEKRGQTQQEYLGSLVKQVEERKAAEERDQLERQYMNDVIAYDKLWKKIEGTSLFDRSGFLRRSPTVAKLMELHTKIVENSQKLGATEPPEDVLHPEVTALIAEEKRLKAQAA